MQPVKQKQYAQSLAQSPTSVTDAIEAFPSPYSLPSQHGNQKRQTQFGVWLFPALLIVALLFLQSSSDQQSQVELGPHPTLCPLQSCTSWAPHGCFRNPICRPSEPQAVNRNAIKQVSGKVVSWLQQGCVNDPRVACIEHDALPAAPLRAA